LAASGRVIVTVSACSGPASGITTWVPGAEAALIPGTGHSLPLERADEVNGLSLVKIDYRSDAGSDPETILDLAGKAESGLIEIPDVANARGLREVGCLPDAGPGLSETTAGRDVEQIRAGLESGEITSLLLFGVDPLRDFPDTDGWHRALEAAGHVVCFSMNATGTPHAPLWCTDTIRPPCSAACGSPTG